MGDLVIETKGLTRYFGTKCAVRELDLSVRRGEVFAFVAAYNDLVRDGVLLSEKGRTLTVAEKRSSGSS